jgi:hypothetical protein
MGMQPPDFGNLYDLAHFGWRDRAWLWTVHVE